MCVVLNVVENKDKDEDEDVIHDECVGRRRKWRKREEMLAL